MSPDEPYLAPGSTFDDRYEILALLGEGGFGTVYKARQRTTGQPVALKILRLPEHGGGARVELRIARFLREARVCAALHHPNIVQLIDCGKAGERLLYTVFSYAPGETLADVIAREGALAPRETMHLLLEVLDALAYAHAAGVVHRDLKPRNIMVMPSGARRNALVLDFGIGAILGGASIEPAARLTATDDALGTPGYAAPEQLRGLEPTPRADLFAWGLIFLECWTGKPVYSGGSTAEILHWQLGPEPVPLPEALQRHPLGDWLRRATRKDAAERDVDARGLLQALEALDPRTLDPRAPVAPHASLLAGAAAVAPGERRQITAVCCALDVQGSAEGALDPEDTDELLRRGIALSAEIAGRYRGHAPAALGDEVMLYFGLPAAEEDDARRAARAALAIVEAIGGEPAQRGARLVARIGVHTGPVEVSGQRAEGGMVVGATPRRAARLARAARPSTVLVTADAERLMRATFELEPEGIQGIAGGPGPAEGFRLLAPQAERGTPATPERVGVPLVGRSHEMDLLLERFRRVCGGAGQSNLVTGEPGIGKSRLARELRGRLLGEPHTFLEIRCSPDTQNLALYPVLEMLGRALALDLEASPRGRVERLSAQLARHGLTPAEAVPLLAPLLGLPVEAPFTPLDLSPQRQKELSQDAILALLFAMAEDRPVLLLLEDLQWADPSTLELTGKLLEEAPSAALFVLLTARPELSPPFSMTGVQQIILGRLEPAQIEVMVSKLVGDKPLPPGLAEQIASRTDGVPLFVEELVRTMIESGVLVEREDRYEIGRPLAQAEIPATLRGLLLSRLDRLGHARETAQIAAALGREFALDVLTAVSPVGPAAVQANLDQLVSAGLVFRRRRIKDPLYVFKHALIRDAAYESLSRAARRQIHARIARTLEERFADITTSRPDLLAQHHAEAEQKREAIAYAQKAAGAALQRSAYAEAVRQIGEAIPWVEAIEDPRQRTSAELELSSLLMPALMATTSYGAPRLRALTDRMLVLSDSLGTSPYTFPTLYALAFYHHVQSERRRALELSERLVELARLSGDVSQDLAAHAVLAQCLGMAGRFEEARAAAERAISLHDPVRHRDLVLVYGVDPKAFAHVMLGWALAVLGHLDRAVVEYERAIEWSRALNQPNMLSLTLFFFAIVRRLRGEPDRVLEAAEEASAISDRFGLPFNKAYAGLFIGWARQDVAMLSGILDAHRAAGQVACRPFYLSFLAEAEAAHGQIAAAIGHLDEGLRFAEEHGDHFFLSAVLRLKGRLLLAQDPEATAPAEACYRRAIDVARGQRARTEELDAAVGLAHLLRRQGRGEEAHALLSAAYGWFTEGFASRTLLDARDLLDELSRRGAEVTGEGAGS